MAGAAVPNPLPQSKLSVDDFAKQIKAKYPDYAPMDNKELVDKITTKYPEYKERINFDGGQKKSPTQSVSSTGSNPSHDFSKGYKPTSQDLATKKSFDDLENSFDKAQPKFDLNKLTAFKQAY